MAQIYIFFWDIVPLSGTFLLKNCKLFANILIINKIFFQHNLSINLLISVLKLVHIVLISVDNSYNFDKRKNTGNSMWKLTFARL